MNIFISYSRVDEAYCGEIVGMLDIHDVWYDSEIDPGDMWWREIQVRIQACDIFMYLISPESLQSKWCREEFKLAQLWNKKILPVLIDEKARHMLPDELSEYHYADMAEGLTTRGYKVLYNGLYKIEKELQEQGDNLPGNVNPGGSPFQPREPLTEIGRASQAMDEGRFEEAIFILKTAQTKIPETTVIPIDAMITQAKIGLEEQKKRKSIELEYKMIGEMVRRKQTQQLGCQALQSFLREHPNEDSDNLMQICRGRTAMPTNVRVLDTTTAHTHKRDAPRHEQPQLPNTQRPRPKGRVPIPSLEWVSIPAGTTLGIWVDGFKIMRYPVTNRQFSVFVRDARGYTNETWWRFSPFAVDWLRKNPKPVSPRFKYAEHPRENVTWYASMAFANWLGTHLGKTVMLPTQAQWRRAALGDDIVQPKLLPWGNTPDHSRANSSESGFRRTTPVTQFETGKSIYDVYDLVGNVWEWCLNASGDSPDMVSELTSQRQRAMLGGSWNTRMKHFRADTEFYLDPYQSYGTIGFRLVMLG